MTGRTDMFGTTTPDERLLAARDAAIETATRVQLTDELADALVTGFAAAPAGERARAGARAVLEAAGFEVEASGDPGSCVSYARGDGALWNTWVCCGPEAPAPYRYSETIEQVLGYRSLKITEHTPEGKIRTYTRHYPGDLVDEVGLDVVWRMMRDEYAAVTEGERA